MGAIYLSFYMIPKQIIDQYEKLFPLLAFSILLVNSIFLTYPLWGRKLKRKSIIGPLWAFGIFYNLFFATTLLMIMNQFHFIHVMLLMTNLMLAAWVLHWPFMLLLGSAGTLLACYVVKYLLHQPILMTSLGHPQYIMLYAAMLFVFCLIILAQQKNEKKILVDRSRTLEELQHTTKMALIKLKTAPERFARQLNRNNHSGFETAYEETLAVQEAIQDITMPDEKKGALKDMLESLASQIKDSTIHLEKVIDLIENEQTLQESSMQLKEFLDRLVDRAYALPQPIRLACINMAGIERLQADFSKLYDLFLETLAHMKHYNPGATDYFLHVQDTKLIYPTRQEGGYNLPAIAFSFTTTPETPQIKDNYPCTDTPTPFPYLESDWYATQAANILYAHYGYVDVEKAPKSYFFVVPFRINFIRPKLIENKKGKEFTKKKLEKALYKSNSS